MSDTARQNARDDNLGLTEIVTLSWVEVDNAVDIRNRILTIRGVQVMIDRDLAHLYQVEAKQFNRQVQRNIERFPPDFMFRLSKEEAQDLRCQIGTSSWGGDRYLPSAFTEQGIAMLSGILRSPKAIVINIAIMRAFVAMRRYLISHGQVL